MAEFLGARISLISKSDVRYVGTLHEINSENSTVALENVKSFGTEGRRPDEEIPASDDVYDYIIFRGGDVKNLTIEEPPPEPKTQPQVPNDPAIIQSGPRPAPRAQPPPSQPPPQPQQSPYGLPQSPQPHPHQRAPFPQQQYNMYQNRFGGPPGGPGFAGAAGAFHGYPGMSYAGQYGWGTAPGQNFPGQAPPPYGIQGPGPAPHVGMPEQQTSPPSQNEPKQAPLSAELSAAVPKANVQLPARVTPPTTGAEGKTSTTPQPTGPLTHRPEQAQPVFPPTASGPPTQPEIGNAKRGGIFPAVPFMGQRAAPQPHTNTDAKSGQAVADAAAQYQNSTQAATAAVAAAMAKLGSVPAQQQSIEGKGSEIDNLARKVNEMRTEDKAKSQRQPGAGNHPVGQRGGRGGRRGGRDHGKGLEVPNTDFDFESANAKFNKQDLVKEAIAGGSPADTPGKEVPPATNGDAAPNGTSEDVKIPAAPASYNKSSFFDDISSEAKERAEAAEARSRPSGAEFRSEERRRNQETFGMASVDSHRGGYQGRGRGRGFRGHGRGGGRGAGGYRGRGNPNAAAPAQAGT